MIKRAKVDGASVRALRIVASEAKSFSELFGRGIHSLEQMMRICSGYINQLREDVSHLHAAKGKLQKTIRSLKLTIAKIKSEIEKLKVEIGVLRAKLAITSPVIVTADEDGKVHTESNPEYESLKEEIDQLEEKVCELETELQPYQQRLEKAIDVDDRISSHIDQLGAVLYSLEEKYNTCKQLGIKLGDIKQTNHQCSAQAFEGLKKIEKVIDSYLKIKMQYESSGRTSTSSSSSPEVQINVSINATRSTVNNVVHKAVTPEAELPKNDKTQDKKPGWMEIIRHRIKFDENGHVCSYEGKSFGGLNTTYEERIQMTPKPDDFRGYYTGKRGESKYIPTDRTGEGIRVRTILAGYGRDGIEYRNGEPDFEVCAEAVVTIPNMTNNREDYFDSEGQKRSGNYAQADKALADIWKNAKKDNKTDWEARDVFNYRKANGLTWHEKCDTETMVLVPTEINDYFKHSGGCSECRKRDGSESAEGDFDE